MHKFLLVLFLIYVVALPAFCDIFQGGVSKDGVVGPHRVIDAKTNAPISGAKISLPQDGYSTYSDSNGNFQLNADIAGQTVLSVEKQGYKPFSVTINQSLASKPIILGVQKSTPKDITIETHMFHLGDNSYSELSANAGEFKVKSVGPYFSKYFKLPDVAPGSKVTLVIGSIIGIDTMLAKSMGQNRISSAYASPPEIYFNGNKIAEIEINGDGQRINIPSNLVKPNQKNEVTIKTGKNMAQTAYVDYDDIEFMNLSIETR